ELRSRGRALTDDHAVDGDLAATVDQADLVFGDVHQQVPGTQLARHPAPALEARLALASLGIGPGGEGGEGAAQAAVLRVLRREPLEHAADRAQGERLLDQQRDPLWRERWRGDVEPAPLRRADMAV